MPGVRSDRAARLRRSRSSLGLQGQSWGGYQTAYIDHADAHVRRGDGRRAGGEHDERVRRHSLGLGHRARPASTRRARAASASRSCEAPQLYIENSPLFHLDRVTTPLFIMNNDMDDAVPWYQGIEFFVGMRRLGKEVYFIDYNNDVHNPASRANQKDIAMRMQQFFDNKLKGAPAPDWMVHGIPYVAKGKDQLAPAPVQAGTVQPDVQKKPVVILRTGATKDLWSSSCRELHSSPRVPRSAR